MQLLFFSELRQPMRGCLGVGVSHVQLEILVGAPLFGTHNA